MRDGLRHALLVVAGLLAVLLVVIFTVYGLTTYGSIRHVVGDIALHPDKAAALESQYEDMATYFAGGGSTFTFRFNSAPVSVSKSQVSGLSQDEVISLVLDQYSSDLYNDRLTTGSPGFAGIFFNAAGNLIYLLIMLVTAILFIAFTAGAIMPFPEKPISDRLKSAGKVIAIVCVIAFFLFAFAPGLLKSLAWGSINNTEALREVLDIIEPAIVPSLLRNTILMVLIGAALFGAGYYVETQGGKPVTHSAGAGNTASKRSASPPRARQPENKKRRSL